MLLKPAQNYMGWTCFGFFLDWDWKVCLDERSSRNHKTEAASGLLHVRSSELWLCSSVQLPFDLQVAGRQP